MLKHLHPNPRTPSGDQPNLTNLRGYNLVGIVYPNQVTLMGGSRPEIKTPIEKLETHYKKTRDPETRRILTQAENFRILGLID